MRWIRYEGHDIVQKNALVTYNFVDLKQVLVVDARDSSTELTFTRIFRELSASSASICLS